MFQFRYRINVLVALALSLTFLIYNPVQLPDYISAYSTLIVAWSACLIALFIFIVCVYGSQSPRVIKKVLPVCLALAIVAITFAYMAITDIRELRLGVFTTLYFLLFMSAVMPAREASVTRDLLPPVVFFVLSVTVAIALEFANILSVDLILPTDTHNVVAYITRVSSLFFLAEFCRVAQNRGSLT